MAAANGGRRMAELGGDLPFSPLTFVGGVAFREVYFALTFGMLDSRLRGNDGAGDIGRRRAYFRRRHRPAAAVHSAAAIQSVRRDSSARRFIFVQTPLYLQNDRQSVRHYRRPRRQS